MQTLLKYGPSSKRSATGFQEFYYIEQITAGPWGEYHVIWAGLRGGYTCSVHGGAFVSSGWVSGHSVEIANNPGVVKVWTSVEL
jgi:hypothetical protein